MKYAIFELLMMAVMIGLCIYNFRRKSYVWAIINGAVAGYAFAFFLAILTNKGVI